MIKWLAYSIIAIGLVLAVWVEAQYKADIPVEKLRKEYAFADSKFLHYDSTEVHYRSTGVGSTLLLVHGFGGNLRNWAAWQGLLSDSLNVVTMDLPGYGLTGPISSERYCDSAQVAFLSAFVDSMALDTFYLGGNSMGGSIAWHYALQHPEKVKKLILVNSSGYANTTSSKSTPIGFKMLQNKTLSGLMKKITPESVIRKTLLKTYANDSLVTAEEVKTYMDLLLREGNREVLVQRMQQSFAGRDTALIQGLSMPTLILWGDQDNIINVQSAYKFQRDIPTNRLIVYAGIGHLPMHELPLQSSKDLREFLKEEHP